MEVSGLLVLQLIKLENKISSSAKLNIDYDKMKFEQIYNEEMKKLDDAKK